MTKLKIKEMINICLKEKHLCRIFFRYDENYRYYIPLIMGRKMFLGIEEDDFILDGYAIRKFQDITKAQIKDDICEKILIAEGIIDSITTPEVNLSTWETIFKSLQKRGKNVIIEHESLDEDKYKFEIGRIEKVYRKFVYIRHFDADGIWQPESHKIPYSEITTVTFASRYVETFSKYLGELPDNFGK